MLKISEEAEAAIREIQKKPENSNLKLTLLSAGAGCGAPVIKLEMRAPLEGDTIVETGGFTFHIRPSALDFIDGGVITTEDTFWGKRLKVKTLNGCR